MKKNRRFVLSAILFNLTLLAFASGSQAPDSGNAHPGGGPGRSSGGSRDSRQVMPMPSDSELTMVRLQYLADGDQDYLALDSDQAASIIPILKDWLETLLEKPDSDADEFVERISEVLTDEQNLFIPPPPGGMGRPQNGESGGQQGGRPQNGESGGQLEGRPMEGSQPEEMDLSEIIPELIEILGEL